jgi:hypothetical protein
MFCEIAFRGGEGEFHLCKIAASHSLLNCDAVRSYVCHINPFLNTTESRNVRSTAKFLHRPCCKRISLIDVIHL